MSAAPSLAPSAPPQMAATDDDPEATEAALRRLTPKSRIRLLPSVSKLRLKRRFRVQQPATTSEPDSLADHVGTPPRFSEETGSIVLDAQDLSDVPGDHNVYRWAILYENQRGLTIFSSPYYSSLSLLPFDPLPFTVPCASTKRYHQPNVSLLNYPLPDGTWRWVSKNWMVDMRTDLGVVQHDGFEYNWSFREKNWHAEVGAFSTGAWVRRRRWVRLMMRPARQKPGDTELNDPSTSSYLPESLPTSSTHPGAETPCCSTEHERSQIWQGNSQQDWIRCYRLLRNLKQDGCKLDHWRTWLEPHIKEGVSLESALNDKNYLTDILRTHANDILRSFVFPDSRAQFLRLLKRAGLLDGSDAGLQEVFSVAEADFWSYATEESLGGIEDG